MDYEERISRGRSDQLNRRQLNRGLVKVGLSGLGLALLGCARKAEKCDLTGEESLAILRDAIDRFHGSRPLSADPPPTAFDIYLSPHPDDVCYSLGMLAATRRAGALLTVFTISRNIAQPIALLADPLERVRQVTALRLTEDQRFASDAGLRLVRLGFLDAPLRGRALSDRSKVVEDAELIEKSVLREVEIVAANLPPGHHAWLFCPMGIGGHPDHLAVMTVVLRNLAELSASHRIAFYEDLPYASDTWKRIRGIARFNCAWRGRELERYSLYLGASVQRKVDLIRIYASQFQQLPDSIATFTPARLWLSEPHEAVWVEA